MRRRILAALAVLFIVSMPGAASASPKVWKDGQTVVTFTFDGGYKDQQLAADILAQHNMAGTFYVNSGYIGYPAYMTTEGLRTVARDRSEIGGGSLYNDDLDKVTTDRGTSEVCDDRATLSQLGFQVTSFSYPYGDDSPAAKAIVQGCGYNNSRRVAGLWAGPEECASCPRAETLPPTDDFRIRTLGQSSSVSYIKQHVMGAERHGGGWMPLVFSHVCVCPKLGDAGITPQDFAKLATWVASEQDSGRVKVLTMDQVMAGDLKPIVGNPLRRIMPAGYVPPPKPPSARSAVSLWGFHVNQGTLVGLGLVAGLAVVITYRTATRGNRYVS